MIKKLLRAYITEDGREVAEKIYEKYIESQG